MSGWVSPVKPDLYRQCVLYVKQGCLAGRHPATTWPVRHQMLLERKDVRPLVCCGGGQVFAVEDDSGWVEMGRG